MALLAFLKVESAWRFDLMQATSPSSCEAFVIVMPVQRSIAIGIMRANLRSQR